MLDAPLPVGGGGGGGGGALALLVEQGRAEGQIAGAVGGGEEGFAFAQGDEQQVGSAAPSRQLEAVDGQWSWDGEELADLSSGAVLARYPGFETSAEEQADLVQIASKLRQALRILLGPDQQED